MDWESSHYGFALHINSELLVNCLLGMLEVIELASPGLYPRDLLYCRFSVHHDRRKTFLR